MVAFQQDHSHPGADSAATHMLLLAGCDSGHSPFLSCWSKVNPLHQQQARCHSHEGKLHVLGNEITVKSLTATCLPQPKLISL